MASSLFGTDGIRGRAGEPPLDEATTFAVGAALAERLARTKKPSVLIGADTRESSEGIAQTLAAGLQSGGVAAHYAGVIPTPGVAHATERGSFSSGVMISASHNPFEDNGIKVFGPFGYKIPDEQETETEEAVSRLLAQRIKPARLELAVDAEISRSYVRHLVRASADGLETAKLRAVVDCANGAASALAPLVFETLGIEAEFLANRPDGRNINRGCGSLHMDGLARRVTESGADVGIAFDGDADRCLLLDETGRLLDGDNILLAAGVQMKRRGQLHENRVVATVMSNIGLEKALEREGVALSRTPVGDKHVLEEMLRCGAALGGEQSGHVIFGDYATTGDGLLTALMLLGVAAERGEPFSSLRQRLKSFPQKLVNIRVRERKALRQIPPLQQAVAASELELAGNGRVLVRYSGTEPLVRIMVEAERTEDVERHAGRLAGLFEQHLGA